MIDKSTAFTIAGNDYRLCDKEGKEWKIYGIENDYFSVTNPSEHLAKWVSFDDIGKHFFILAHPMENLTKEINGIIPIVELAKIGVENYPSGRHVIDSNEQSQCIFLSDGTLFGYDANGFYFKECRKPLHVSRQPELFNYLNKNHFSHLLPEGSWKGITI